MAEPIRVLLVDDQSLVRSGFRMLIDSEDDMAVVGEASNGAEALAKLRARPYGLVISDWNMSPMTGFELLQAMRADPALHATPLIMVTAESKTDNVVAARKAGVSAYIVKPFNAATLKSKIDSVFLSRAA